MCAPGHLAVRESSHEQDDEEISSCICLLLPYKYPLHLKFAQHSPRTWAAWARTTRRKNQHRSHSHFGARSAKDNFNVALGSVQSSWPIQWPPTNLPSDHLTSTVGPNKPASPLDTLTLSCTTSHHRTLACCPMPAEFQRCPAVPKGPLRRFGCARRADLSSSASHTRGRSAV